MAFKYEELLALVDAWRAKSKENMDKENSGVATGYNNAAEDLNELIHKTPVQKAVLSKGERVEATIPAWTTELNWRAEYTGTTALGHAIDEIIRLQLLLIELTEKPIQ